MISGSAGSSTLFWIGVSMIALSLVLPDRHQSTFHFAARWTPVGTALLVLAPPPACHAPLAGRLFALTLLATLTVSTTAAREAFERIELAVLRSSLPPLPHEPRLLGLDFYRLSRLVKTQSFFQVVASGQVLHGGTLDFSFASFPTSPVAFRVCENPPWTPGLEWMPNEILDSLEELLFFDAVLVNAYPAGDASFEKKPLLLPGTDPECWRLECVVGGPSLGEPRRIE